MFSFITHYIIKQKLISNSRIVLDELQSQNSRLYLENSPHKTPTKPQLYIQNIFFNKKNLTYTATLSDRFGRDRTSFDFSIHMEDWASNHFTITDIQRPHNKLSWSKKSLISRSSLCCSHIDIHELTGKFLYYGVKKWFEELPPNTPPELNRYEFGKTLYFETSKKLLQDIFDNIRKGQTQTF